MKNKSTLQKRIKFINDTVRYFDSINKHEISKKLIGRSNIETIANNDMLYSKFKSDTKDYKQVQKDKKKIDKKYENIKKERQKLKENIKKRAIEIEKENVKRSKTRYIEKVRELYSEKPKDKVFIMNEIRTGSLKLDKKLKSAIDNENTFEIDNIVRKYALGGMIETIEGETVKGGVFKHNQDLQEIRKLEEMVMKDKNWRTNLNILNDILYNIIIPSKYKIQTEEEDMPSQYGDYNNMIWEKGEGKDDIRFFKSVANDLLEEYKKIIVPTNKK